MSNKTLGLVLVVIAVIAIGSYFYPKSTETTIERVVNSEVGSVTGPDTYFSYVANNNFQRYAVTRKLVTGTTTPCDIVSPPATSTLVFGNVNILNSTTTATVLTIAKASTGYATTTVLASTTIAASAQVNLNINATSSTAVDSNGISLVATDRTFGPSTHLVCGVSGNLGTGASAGLIPFYVPNGTVSAEFIRS